MKIGAQLYTLRQYCQTLEDFALTLKKVADMGYPAVQVSATCPFAPEWLKEQLAKNGLQCVLTHTPAPQLLEDARQVAKDHDVFSCKYVGLGYFPFNAETDAPSPADFIAQYLPVARALKAGGKYFMYHNHDGEFRKEGGKLIIDWLAGTFAPDEMGFTLDTYWVQAGGGDPAQWLEKLSGRVPVIHLKDFAYGRIMAALGEGNLNFDRIFEKAEAAKVEYMLVEQDDCNGEDPFLCLQRSYEYLKARGF